jgi:carbamoyl-phosphate synthase large subunit
MVNCNPETVSTDYDTADRLYFEPLTREDVLAIVDVEKPDGVIVQFGGQTPLRLAVPLAKAGVHIFGTSADAIDRAEDRERFGELLGKLGLAAPRWGIARQPPEALAVAAEIGYPVMVRPSYVLGGRAMEIVYDERALRDYLQRTAIARGDASEHPVLLVDEFLRDAVEVDVDVVADRTGAVVVGGIMEHIEEAGIHSGDSACALPPYSLAPAVIEEIGTIARAIARELGVVGLMNAQLAVQDGRVYVLEVNPRASRTVPFVSKATGVPLAKIAARLMVGRTLAELGIPDEPTRIPHVAVKESVFPFVKFPGVDTILGPEMRSTGEVMGIDAAFPLAFAKSQLAAGNALPARGRAFLSVKDGDKEAVVGIARRLLDIGFRLVATRGTAARLAAAGLPVETTHKVMEGRPHCVDEILSGTIDLVVNTTAGAQEIRDSFSIRRSALQKSVSYFTTIRAAQAAVDGIAAEKARAAGVTPLQEYHRHRETTHG